MSVKRIGISTSSLTGTPGRRMLPFPNGWYVAAFSHELVRGAVMPITLLDRELVLFRTDHGVAHAVDPYCPHMGAHLGHGGTVVGDQFRCPFHHWKFDAAGGKCTHIPAGDPIPPLARLRTWEVRESSQMVQVWFHAKNQSPSWQVGEMPGMDETGWSRWATVDWTLDATIQDLSENDSDTQHSPVLHDFTEHLPVIEMDIDGPLFKWKMEMPPNLSFLPQRLVPENARMTITTHRHGMSIGWICTHVRLHDKWNLRFQTLAITKPIDHETVNLRMLVRVRKTRSRVFTALALKTYVAVWNRTINQDIKIWRHKTYLQRPVASKSDAGIMRFRRWSMQFY